MGELNRWFVYMLECADKTIYTGITNSVESRIAKHNSGIGAKYTRSRLPVKLLAFWEFPSKSDAAKREFEVKQLSRKRKILLLIDVKN